MCGSPVEHEEVYLRGGVCMRGGGVQEGGGVRDGEMCMRGRRCACPEHVRCLLWVYVCTYTHSKHLALQLLCVLHTLLLVAHEAMEWKQLVVRTNIMTSHGVYLSVKPPKYTNK